MSETPRFIEVGDFDVPSAEGAVDELVVLDRYEQSTKLT